MTRRRRVVRGRGAPRGAIALMRRAYLLVLKAAHEGALREHGVAALPEIDIQDSAKPHVKVPAEVLRLVERATRTIQASADEDLQEIPGISAAKVAGGENLVRAFRKRNVALIRTLAQEHFGAVTDVLAEAGNLHTKGLAEALHAVTEQYGISARRAEFWAVDQTLKLNANVVEAKHRSLGIVEYKWRTSRDSAVRETHAELEGKTFRYDDPPETGTGRHNPGEDYRCRCHADPVLPAAGKAKPRTTRA